jgi:hypothetical protein
MKLSELSESRVINKTRALWLLYQASSSFDVIALLTLTTWISDFSMYASDLTFFTSRFALDLVEVFFQIVHTRIPLLNPAQFRKRLNLQTPLPLSNGERPLHPALVATVLAWGAKFSEHPLLVADRRRPGGQSALAKVAIDRARELAESMKVHRIPSPDHVVIALLIEPLQSR